MVVSKQYMHLFVQVSSISTSTRPTRAFHKTILTSSSAMAEGPRELYQRFQMEGDQFEAKL